MTGTSGQITSATNYAPYGNVLNSFSIYDTSLGFTGEYSDPTGLLYLRARYYNASMGTFMSRDPVRGSIGGAVSRWNAYSYVSGNPINRVDLSGMIWEAGSGAGGHRYYAAAALCSAYKGIAKIVDILGDELYISVAILKALGLTRDDIYGLWE